MEDPEALSPSLTTEGNIQESSTTEETGSQRSRSDSCTEKREGSRGEIDPGRGGNCGGDVSQSTARPSGDGTADGSCAGKEGEDDEDTGCKYEDALAGCDDKITTGCKEKGKLAGSDVLEDGEKVETSSSEPPQAEVPRNEDMKDKNESMSNESSPTIVPRHEAETRGTGDSKGGTDGGNGSNVSGGGHSYEEDGENAESEAGWVGDPDGFRRDLLTYQLSRLTLVDLLDGDDDDNDDEEDDEEVYKLDEMAAAEEEREEVEQVGRVGDSSTTAIHVDFHTDGTAFRRDFLSEKKDFITKRNTSETGTEECSEEDENNHKHVSDIPLVIYFVKNDETFFPHQRKRSIMSKLRSKSFLPRLRGRIVGRALYEELVDDDGHTSERLAL